MNIKKIIKKNFKKRIIKLIEDNVNIKYSVFGEFKDSFKHGVVIFQHVN